MSEVGFTTPLFRRRLLQVWFGVMFLGFLMVLASQWFGKTCSQLDQPAEARMASCNRAWWFGLPALAIEPESQVAGYWLAYGAAEADLGRIDAGKDHYRRALRGVGLRFPINLPEDLKYAHEEARFLLDFASQLPEGSAARQAFVEVLAEGR